MTAKEVFVSVMNLLADSFHRALTEAAIDGYWMALEDVRPEQLQFASRRALRECKFMPTPAELRELALGKGWKERQDSASIQAATEARLRALEAIPATAEEIAQSRREVGLMVKDLVEGTDLGKLLSIREPVVFTEDEKQAAVARIERELAERANGGEKS